MQEFVSHSWYKYADESKGLHPFDGVTEPNFVLGANTQGTPTRIAALDESAKYSWIKAPRWKGHAMEVGPLARYIIGFAQGNPEFKEPTVKLLKALDAPVEALFSTLGRTAARGLECQWAAHKMMYFFNKLVANIKAGDTSTANVVKWDPKTGRRPPKGRASRRPARRAGPLGQDREHEDRVLPVHRADHLEWRPARLGRQYRRLRGLAHGHPMADPAKPLEILRTLHSFDPCLACSTHVMSDQGRDLATVTVR